MKILNLLWKDLNKYIYKMTHVPIALNIYLSGTYFIPCRWDFSLPE